MVMFFSDVQQSCFFSRRYSRTLVHKALNSFDMSSALASIDSRPLKQEECIPHRLATIRTSRMVQGVVLPRTCGKNDND